MTRLLLLMTWFIQHMFLQIRKRYGCCVMHMRRLREEGQILQLHKESAIMLHFPILLFLDHDLMQWMMRMIYVMLLTKAETFRI